MNEMEQKQILEQKQMLEQRMKHLTKYNQERKQESEGIINKMREQQQDMFDRLEIQRQIDHELELIENANTESQEIG